MTDPPLDLLSGKLKDSTWDPPLEHPKDPLTDRVWDLMWDERRGSLKDAPSAQMSREHQLELQ